MICILYLENFPQVHDGRCQKVSKMESWWDPRLLNETTCMPRRLLFANISLYSFSCLHEGIEFWPPCVQFACYPSACVGFLQVSVLLLHTCPNKLPSGIVMVPCRFPKNENAFLCIFADYSLRFHKSPDWFATEVFAYRWWRAGFPPSIPYIGSITFHSRVDV